jgi:hypothetical protein
LEELRIYADNYEKMCIKVGEYEQQTKDAYDVGKQDTDHKLRTRLKEAEGLLGSILKWIEDHEQWWMSSPDRGGYDPEQIESFLRGNDDE